VALEPLTQQRLRESTMLDEILQLTSMLGVTVLIHTTNYKWDSGPSFIVQIERDADGEVFKVNKSGKDLRALWAEATTIFYSRISNGYAKAELQPNLLEAPKYEEATRADSDDVPF
jgi:hypothetical protein